MGVIHNSDVNTHTVWLETNNDHIINKAGLIQVSANLTLEPGVNVRFRDDRSLFVYANLWANGTISKHINFTHDSAWATTSGWDQIRLLDNGNGTFKYCNFSRGGDGVPMISIETAYNVSFENCKFNYSDDSGIEISSGNVTIRNCTIFNCTTGIKITGGNVVIENTTIYDCPTGIDIDNGNSIIHNNTIYEIYNTGIDIAGGSSTVTNNSINVSGTTAYGIYSASSSTITNNTISVSGTTAYGIYVSSNSPIISNNTIDDTPIGIYINGGSGTISYNNITNSTDKGIEVKGGSPLIIQNNISECDKGVSVSSTTTNFRFNNNILINCNHSIWCEKSAIMENCTIINSTSDNFYLFSSAVVNTLNTSYDDRNNISLGCTLLKQFYLHVKIQDNFNDPVAGATVTIEDNASGSTGYSTNSAGRLNWLRLTEKIFTNTAITNKTPHNISATKAGYNTTTVSKVMNQSWKLTLTIQDIVVPTSSGSTAKYWYNTSWMNVSYSAVDNANLKNITLFYNYSADNSTFTIENKKDNATTITGGSAAGTFTFDFNHDDGFYEFYTIAVDKNNKVEFTPPIPDSVVGRDTVPPEILGWTVDNITEDSVYECHVNVTINDTLSGIGGKPMIRYKYDSTNTTWNSIYKEMTKSSRGSREEANYSYEIPVPPDSWDHYQGKYLAWEVKCEDQAGNQMVSTMSVSTKEYIDYVNHPPTISVSNPLPDLWYNRTIHIRTNPLDNELDKPNDPLYGIAEVQAQYSLNSTDGINGIWKNCSNPVTTDPYDFHWATAGSVGVGTDDMVWLRIRSKDNSGLFSAWDTRKIKIDNEPGTTTHDFVDTWYNSDITINLSAIDRSATGVNGSGISKIMYKINNGSAMDALSNGMPVITTDGNNNTLEYWSIDNQSNVERHNLLYGIRLDKNKPYIIKFFMDNVTEHTSMEENVYIYVNVTDGLSGLKAEPKFRFKLPGESEYRPWQSMLFTCCNQYRGTVELPLNDVWFKYRGEDIEFEVQCTDWANNVASKTLVETVEEIELFPPEIEHIPVNTGYVDQNIKIEAKVTDNEQVVKVQLYYKAIDGTAFTPISMVKEGSTDIYSTSIPAPAKRGSIFYYIRAEDNDQYVVTTPPLNPQENAYQIVVYYVDLDEDGLPDWWEEQYFGDIETHNDLSDPDGDGLSNLMEYTDGTEPDNKDTDDDGMDDGWEAKYGLDPTDPTGINGRDGDPDGDGYSNYEEFKADTDPYDDKDHPKESDGDDNQLWLYIGIIIVVIIVILLLVFLMLRRRGGAGELSEEEAGMMEGELEDESELEVGEEEELDLIKPPVTTMPTEGAVELKELAEPELCTHCQLEIEGGMAALVCPCGFTSHTNCISEDEVRECPQCGKVFDLEALGIPVVEVELKPKKPEIKSEVVDEVEEILTPPENAFFAYIPQKSTENATHDFLEQYYQTKELGEPKLNKDIKGNVTLFMAEDAAKNILDHSKDFGSENEVMGLILGDIYLFNKKTISIAKDVATSELDSTEVEVRFKNFDELFSKLDTLDYDYKILGWYHTHPGHTCFMSPTDIDTQKRMFKHKHQHAVIIDPVNLDIRAYQMDPKTKKKAKERGFAIIKYKETFA